MADVLDVRRLNRATLARQMLLERERVDPVTAVARLCGLQAQEPKPPFTGLWSRLDGFDAGDLHAALHSHEVVRATLMRGTLHLAGAGDYAAWRAALQPMLGESLRLLGDRADGLELEPVLAVARELLEEAPRTFDELRDLLKARFAAVDERVLGFAVRMHLPLVMVPTADRWAFGRNAQFTLAERWLEQPLSHDASPQRLIARYLAAFGPATAADVQTFSGLKGAKAQLRDMDAQLRGFRDEHGRELFDLPDAPRPPSDVPAPPRFLPEFDNLVLAHADRTRLIDDEHRALVTTKNLRVRATFLIDGRVAGTWSVARKRAAATLTLAPFAALPKRAARALQDEGERLLRFLEPDATTFAVDAP